MSFHTYSPTPNVTLVESLALYLFVESVFELLDVPVCLYFTHSPGP